MTYVKCEYDSEDVYFTCPICIDEDVTTDLQTALGQYESTITCEKCGTEYRLLVEAVLDIGLYNGKTWIGGV